MPQLYFTSTQPPGAHRRIPVRKHDRADPRWKPATERKKRVLPQRDAGDNENMLMMFMKMKHMESELQHMESELRRIKAFRRAECKRSIARACRPNGLTRSRGSEACREASAETRRRGGGLAFTFAAAFAASFTKSEDDGQNIPEAQDFEPTGY